MPHVETEMARYTPKTMSASAKFTLNLVCKFPVRTIEILSSALIDALLAIQSSSWGRYTVERLGPSERQKVHKCSCGFVVNDIKTWSVTTGAVGTLVYTLRVDDVQLIASDHNRCMSLTCTSPTRLLHVCTRLSLHRSPRGKQAFSVRLELLQLLLLSAVYSRS